MAASPFHQLGSLVDAGETLTLALQIMGAALSSCTIMFCSTR